MCVTHLTLLFLSRPGDLFKNNESNRNNNNNNNILIKFPIPQSSMALSICPNRTVASVLNIYRFMCPMPTTVSQICQKRRIITYYYYLF